MAKHAVGGKIRERRETLHLSRRELAELADVSQSQIWAVEHGRGSEQSRRAVAEALNRARSRVTKLPPLRTGRG